MAETTHPNRRARNVLNFLKKYELARWLRKHLNWCAKQGMTGHDVVVRAGKELDFQITLPNARNLWKELGNEWPFKTRATGDNAGKVSTALLARNQRLIAAEVVRLFEQLDVEVNDDLVTIADGPRMEVLNADQD